jgi:hypothetical protein
VIAAAAMALARLRSWLYLNGTDRRRWPNTVPVAAQMVARMALPLSTPQQLQPARRLALAMLIAGAGLGIAVLLGALVLWFHYGTAVFFEMIASGISACF